MCPEHRSPRLGDIKKRLANRQPCRLIATSLIEAGVDVDFPAVYCASAGIDAIAQAAGRCNREGKYAAADSMVYVFEPVNRGCDDGLGRHGILVRLEDRSADRWFPFEDIARDFKLIDDATRSILIPFATGGAHGPELIAELRHTENVGVVTAWKLLTPSDAVTEVGSTVDRTRRVVMADSFRCHCETGSSPVFRSSGAAVGAASAFTNALAAFASLA